MKSREKTLTLQVAALVAAGLVVLVWSWINEYRTLGTLAGPLDDTYIHLRFAWNIAHSGGFAFNPGEPLPGSTSPLWVVMLTPAAFSKQALMIFSIALSGVFFIASGVLAWRLARRMGITGVLALTAGAMVMLNGRMLWAGMSGMETTLFAALSLLGFILYLRDREKGGMTWITGLAFGLATTARPEGYMLFLGMLCHRFLSRVHGGRKERPVPWGALLAFALVIAPYVIFSLSTIGHPLPATFLAKEAEFAQFRDKYVRYSLLYFWLDNPVASILLIAVVIRAIHQTAVRRLSYLASSEGLVAGWGLGYLAVSTALTPMPFQFCRYQIPVLPFLLLLVVKFADEALKWAAKRMGASIPPPDTSAADVNAGEEKKPRTFLARAVWLIAAITLLAPQLVSIVRWPAIVTLCSKNIQEMHVTVGNWLERATPRDSVIATMDIGAIGFYSDRRIIDLVGLVTPEVIPYIKRKGMTRRRSEALLQYLEKAGPDYLAVFPNKYPGLGEDEKVMIPIYQVVLQDNQIVASEWMVVYQCMWHHSRPENPAP